MDAMIKYFGIPAVLAALFLYGKFDSWKTYVPVEAVVESIGEECRLVEVDRRSIETTEYGSCEDMEFFSNLSQYQGWKLKRSQKVIVTYISPVNSEQYSSFVRVANVDIYGEPQVNESYRVLASKRNPTTLRPVSQDK